MGLTRVELVVTVHRPALGGEGTGRSVSLSETLRIEPAGAEVTADEIAEAVARLERKIDEALGRLTPVSSEGLEGRADRPLEELIEAYRPRQVELVDLLQEDGELTPAEHATLRRYLTQRGAPPPPAEVAIAAAPSAEPAQPVRPIAEAPLSVERGPSNARPVPELIERYRIENLKQAGAVRARRQISFEEYMALKRHFAHTAPPTAPPRPAQGPPS